MRKDPLTVAAAEIGTTESPANSNKTKYGRWYGLDGYAWCMMFVQWCFQQAGYPLPYKTASCGDLLRWYRENCPERVVSAPKPRDIISYNFGHTGIVESGGNGVITAIEGNTSAGDAGSQSNGGGVFRRVRSLSLVTAYIRAFDDYQAEDPEIDALIDGMSGRQAYALLEKAQKYAAALPAPGWAADELREAVERGITDGNAPMMPVPRYQAAIMAKRAVCGGIEE